MLNDYTGFKKIYVACGYTDLRKGISGLAAVVRFQFSLNPYDRDTLFLFCGKKPTKIKALLWEGDGFLLMYKRLESGAFSWPRTSAEAMEVTPEQFRMLMKGFQVVARRPVTETDSPPTAM